VTGRSRVTNRTTTEYSILRVDKSAGRWEAVPTSLINDARLGFDTRGFAAWLLARPEGWEIRASALPHLLKSGSGHVGRDKARRFLRELARAAYLTHTRRRGADGRWIWDYAFRPISPTSTIDALSVGGSPVRGSTVDGKGVDITHTLNTPRRDKSILNITTTPPPPDSVVVVGDLVEIRYPDCLTGSRLASTRRLVARCPREHRQAVLDELGAMGVHGVVRHPVGLFNRLIERARAGQFVPNRSLPGSPTMAGSDTNLSRPAADAGAATSTSQPRTASDIAMLALTHLRLKWAPEAK
jgi:hypothetical protein